MKIVFKGFKILHLFLKFKMLWRKILQFFLFELYKHCDWILCLLCNILRRKDHNFLHLIRNSLKNELNQGKVKYKAKTKIKLDDLLSFLIG
jgi:hypothetical protein